MVYLNYIYHNQKILQKKIIQFALTFLRFCMKITIIHNQQNYKYSNDSIVHIKQYKKNTKIGI